MCVVADEAHRSHGGGGTALLHEALGGCSEQPAFVTYVAFTATPDPKVRCSTEHSPVVSCSNGARPDGACALGTRGARYARTGA